MTDKEIIDDLVLRLWEIEHHLNAAIAALEPHSHLTVVALRNLRECKKQYAGMPSIWEDFNNRYYK